MAKFDKNMKNAYLEDDELYDDAAFDDGVADGDDEENDANSDFLMADGDYAEEVPEEASEAETAPESGWEDAAAESELSLKEAVSESEQDDAKWYVAHTYSGHENKVKINIEKIVENRGMQDLIQSVIVPTEDVVEVKDGQRKVRTRKMFPGYVIVKMVLTSESWYLIRNTQGVTGFVGHGSDPIPLTPEEVRRMGIDNVYLKFDLEVGEHIKVKGGPFDSFMGVVEEINTERQTVRVNISMFGRETPVELDFGQVEKIV